jgi:hypothetical protein
MRYFRDAKAMARALRDALKAKGVETTHSESLELIATAFGYENWNILSAKIEAAAARTSEERSPSYAGTQNDPTAPKTLYCSFCGKSQHEVQKLIAGSEVFICDECVDLCTGIVEPDDDKELFRLMKGNEETGGRADPALFELARGTSTEELAHYVERGRKGVERNRLALQGIQRRLAIRDDEVPTGDDISALPRRPPRQKRVAWVVARQHTRNRQPVREPSLQIFQGMHRQVNMPGDQGLLDLLDEQPLAADLGEQPVLHPVAGSADRDDLDRSLRGEFGVSRNQTIADEGGLAQRHRAAAGPDAEMAARHWHSLRFPSYPTLAAVPTPPVS